MIKLKTKISSLENLYTASQYRVQDYAFLDLDSKEIESGAAGYLKRTQSFFESPLKSSVPMSSATWREYLKDLRFLIVFNNLELNDLEADIIRLAKRNLKKIRSIQRELNVLESEVIEEEVRFYKDFDFAHHNNFSKKQDRKATELQDWNYDFKTGLSIADDNIAEVYPFVGATLPVLESVSIPISRCLIVGEESDVGDTKQPLISTDPNNCVIDNEIFRYVIIRKEYDETKRKYNHTDSYLTLLLELDSLQTINCFEVIPAGANTVQLISVTYINEAGEEVILGAEVLDAPSGLKVFTEAIRLKYLKLKFKQLAPVNKQSLSVTDSNADLNNLLQGLTWSTRFKDNQHVSIEGRVYDFSIKDIKIWLNRYNSLGYYCSDSKRITDIATAKISNRVEQIPVSVGINFSDAVYNYSTGSTAAEFYLGVKSRRKNKNFFEDLIPIPDSYPIQSETLILSGGYAKLKFYPSLTFEVPRVKVVSIEAINSFRHLVTTVTPHGLVDDDEFFMIGPMSKNVTNDFTVDSVVNDYSFYIQANRNSNIVIDEEDKPNTYLYLADSSPLFNLRRGDVELNIGSDYQVSFGDGVYSNTWDYNKYTEWLVRGPRAGEFSIKIQNPSYIETYYIDYKPLKNQWLGQTNLVKLQHGSAVFDKKFLGTVSEVQTIVLLRSSIQDYYTTSILASYTLGVKKY